MARSYAILEHRRLLVVGLTIGLVTVLFGVMLDLILSGQRSTISLPTQKLIALLNPQLNLTVIEQVEGYELVTFEQAREAVRQARLESATPAVVELMPVVPVPEVSEAGTDGEGIVLPTDSTSPDGTTTDPTQQPTSPPTSTDPEAGESLAVPGEN